MSSNLSTFEDLSFSPLGDDFSLAALLEDIGNETTTNNSNQLSNENFENLSIFSQPFSQNDLSSNTQVPEFSNFYVQTLSEQSIGTNLKHGISNLEQNITMSMIPNSENKTNFNSQFQNNSTMELNMQNFNIPINYGFNEGVEPYRYGGAENVEMFMQRSYSSSSFNGNPNNIGFDNSYDFGIKNQSFMANQIAQMRRACSTSTDDVQSFMANNCANEKGCSTSTDDVQVTESQRGYDKLLYVEVSDFKVGHYSAEERKESIHKYQSKRNQRNFTKTIKYESRKRVADNRARLRGRFARSDETEETPNTANLNTF